jgi:signal transduction histidine kinase
MSLPPAVGSAQTLNAQGRAALGRLRAAKPWRAAGFLLLSFPIGLFWFVVLVVLIAVGAALAIVWVSIPILELALRRLITAARRKPARVRAFSGRAIPLLLALTMRLWMLAARGERARVRAFSGQTIPRPYLPPFRGSPVARARARMHDPAVWRDLAYLLLLFPLGVAELVIVIVLLAVPLSFTTLPLYAWALPHGGPQLATGVYVDAPAEILLVLLLGLLLVVPACLVLIGLSRAHLLLARFLLGPTRGAALAARVDVLTKTRSGVIEAQLLERQRIERDLHDGAQQRLVALAMDLGMAKEKFYSDPQAAQALVESSHQEAKRALADLRDLVRGIYPAVLADRGLDAAISSVAGRSPIPVSVDLRLASRLPEPIEAAAYFVITEALANVAKHSGATEAHVTVRHAGNCLTVDVTDNGVGGAATETGTGLAGLRDRLAALDGRLTIFSPTGGPTTVRAEMPYA